MAIQFLNDLDLNKNQSIEQVVERLATAPSSPVAGQIYYNTSTNQLNYYNGTKWVPLTEAQSIDTMSTQATSLTCTLPDNL